jgi:hypothetical protein
MAGGDVVGGGDGERLGGATEEDDVVGWEVEEDRETLDTRLSRAV